MEATRTATLLNHLPEYTYLNTLPAITYLLFASHFQIPGKLWTLETFGLFGISVCSAPAKDTEAQSESQHTLHYTFKKDHSPHLKKFTTVVIEFAFNKHLLFKHHLCVRQFRNRRSDRDSYRMSASDPFQELVDTLKRILTRSASPPLPASTPTPVTSAISSSSPVMFASPMARPAPYSGDPEECNGFILQCSLTIDLHPQMFLTDQAKIAFVITSLTGPALRWAETVLSQAGPATHSYAQFLAHFREVFSSSPGDSSVGEQLYQLRQGSMTIHQYALKFRTLAAASGWNEPSLITAFRQGLNPRLKSHLAAYDDTHGSRSSSNSPSDVQTGLISDPRILLQLQPLSLLPITSQRPETT